MTYVDVWAGCLQLIRDRIPPQSFDTWFRPIKPVRLDQHVLTIEVPSQFFYEWLEEHYVDLLKEAIHAMLGPSGSLEYAIVVDNHAPKGNGQSHPGSHPSGHLQMPSHSVKGDSSSKMGSSGDLDTYILSKE